MWKSHCMPAKPRCIQHLSVDSVCLGELSMSHTSALWHFSFSSLIHSVCPSCTHSVNTFSIPTPAARERGKMSAAAWNQWKIHHTDLLLCMSLWWQLGGGSINFQCKPSHLKAHSVLCSLSFIFRERKEKCLLKNLLRLTESAASVQQLQGVQWDLSMS